MEELISYGSMCGAQFDAYTPQPHNNIGLDTLTSKEVASSKEQAKLPSIENLIGILQNCRKKKNLAYAEVLHIHMYNKGLETHTMLGNFLVPMFVECGSMNNAQQVFNRLAYRNEYSWTSLIQGYVKCGESQHALDLLHKMQEGHVQPSGHTLVASLKACARLKSVQRGLHIHTEIVKGGLERGLFVGNSLVDMYAKCGHFAEAQKVFIELPVQDVVTWTALTAGFVRHELGEDALNCLEQMQLQGIFPNSTTLVCSLKACGSIGAIDRGQKIHAEVVKVGLERDLFVCSSIMDMYAKCGSLVEARELFDELRVWDVVLWNTLITGYVDNGLYEEALTCVEQMRLQGVPLDDVTYVCSLKACGNIGTRDRGQELHIASTKEGLENDPFVSSALVCMYSKCGMVGEAWQVFDQLPSKDIFSWTALIYAFANHGLGVEALKLFEEMRLEGMCPDSVVLLCVLKACSNVGTLNKGQEIHAKIAMEGLESDPLVRSTLINEYAEYERSICAHVYTEGSLEAIEIVFSTALIDMYGKCGSMVDAQQVFDQMPVKVLETWTALMTGYASQGDSELVFCLFDRMREGRVQPQETTFLSVLTVCSHGGLIDEGLSYFESMNRVYGITPSQKHHNCFIDLLSRAGRLDEAVAMIEKMPFQPDSVTWSIGLGACGKQNEIEFGRQALECIMKLEVQPATSHVMKCNVYMNA